MRTEEKKTPAVSILLHDNQESCRDILQGAMYSYMTQVCSRMNEVMKVLVSSQRSYRFWEY